VHFLPLLPLAPIFLIGLLGSIHCAGMCGGIVSAFSVAAAPRRRIPIAIAVITPTRGALRDDALHVVAYNAGRIGSYMTAGAIAGSVSSSLRTLSSLSTIETGGYWLANLMLVALGLYLMDVWHGLAYLEAVGQRAWKHVQPLTRSLLPMDTPAKAFLLGGLWGWLPCGMVYSVLLTAMLTGSALAGAAVMLAFGLGTLPMLLCLGMLGTRLQAWTRQRQVRIASGLLVLAFGLLGLWRADHGMPADWLDGLCLTPSVHP
jgi:sulfite exporter TauE/SafE